MTYNEALFAKLGDSEQWPSLRSAFLDELDRLAARAFKENTVHGRIAALLIWHELCEEMVRLLLRDCQFFIQIRVFPAEIRFPPNDRAMFGQLLDELKKGLSFEGKQDFLDACACLNSQRIEVVHRLSRRTSLKHIRKDIRRAKETYDVVFSQFERIHDQFRLMFHDLAKDLDELKALDGRE